jgi:hypothetical protein
MLRGQEIDINNVEVDEPYILDIWNPEPDNEDDQSHWTYNVKFIEEEEDIFTFEKINNETPRYVQIDMNSVIDSTTHKLYKAIQISRPVSRMSPVSFPPPIRYGGKKRKRTKKSKKIRKKSKTAKRTKRAKKTKRRNNKRKLSRKRKRGGGQCTSKPASHEETLLPNDIERLVSHFIGKYTPYNKNEFKSLLQEATFKSGVTGPKLVKSTEGYGDSEVVDYYAVLTPYDQIVELIKDNSDQHQLMSKIRTAHINN